MVSEGISHEQEVEVERLLALANLQRMRKQWAEAEETCRKAVEIAPKMLSPREMLADLLLECGKLDMALSEYRTAMELAPGKPSLETKYAKVTLEIAEREREKAIAKDMLENPHRYTARTRNPLWAFMLSAILPGLGQFYNGEMVKAAVCFGVFILFVISWPLLQPRYPGGIDLNLFLQITHPVVKLLGMLTIIIYIYGLIDAMITADKSSKAARNKNT